MTTPHSTPLHLTGTRVAEYFRFGCERQLRYDLVPMARRGDDVPHRNDDASLGPVVAPRLGAGLLRAAGRRWEQACLHRLIAKLDGERVLVQGWSHAGDPLRLPAERVIRTLRSPGAVEVLVQPELRLPDPAAFARRFGVRAPMLEIAPAVPDLIRIRRLRDGRRLFQIVDIKASRDARIGHFAQVAYYSFLLEAIWRDEGNDTGAPDVRWGRIWSRDGRGPHRFALGAYRYHVEKVLRDDLGRVAALAPDACAWHLSPRCAGCLYFEHCRAEAERTDDLARVVGISPRGKRVLHGRGIRTVERLSRSLARDTYTGCSSLESQAGRLKQRAQAVQHDKVFDVASGTHLMPPSEDVRVTLTAEGDPVTGRCFALGLRVDAGPGTGVETGSSAFLASAGTAAAEREMLGALLARLEGVLEAAGAGTGQSLHFFVYDRGELDALRDVLLRHAAEGEARPALARLLRFLSPRALTARPDVVRAAPGTVLVEAVSTLFALPVPFAYDLAAVAERLRPSTGARPFRPGPGYGSPLSSQVAFERIHNAWRARPFGDQTPAEVRERIEATVLGKLAAIDSVVRAVRERSTRRARLRMHKDAFPRAEPEAPLPDRSLETLRLFAELESSTEVVATHALHALPSAERARRMECINGMDLVERRVDGSLVFSFDPACRDAKFRPGDFGLLLTNDDETTLADLARHPWKRRRLMVELVDYDLRADPPRVVLAPSGDLARAEQERLVDLERRCVLDRAAVDFQTGRIVATLRALAGEGGAARTVRALLDGHDAGAWSPPFDGGDEVFREVLAPLGARMGRAVLNEAQERAWRDCFGQRLSLVWGPPGTGKTYLLAWMVLGLALAAYRAGQPCRVLIAAATHRAITNVLLRLEREARDAGLGETVRTVKLRGSGSPADAELVDTAVELAPDARLPALLAEAEASGQPLVVGGTVWSLWKRMRAAAGGDPDTAGDAPVRPWFDVVVVDEASQMKVGESLIALSSMRDDARVILCGDHQQLAPVVRGRYGPDAGTLFGSVFEHLARFTAPRALRESRRMNRALVAYPRQAFYPGLVSLCPERALAIDGDACLCPDDRLLRDAFLRPDDAVVLCTYSEGYQSSGQRNDFEAHLAAHLARLARRLMVHPETGRRLSPAEFAGQGLAMISPHRAQNSALYAELRRQGLTEEETPVVDTVERMQGNERDMIIVSYAVADREYAEAEAEFLLNPNRFNVAITRARSKLVVLVSEAVLNALPLDEGVLTGSMALKGYAAHCRDRVDEVDVPAPDGSRVRVRCHYRMLHAPGGAPPSTAPRLRLTLP